MLELKNIHVTIDNKTILDDISCTAQTGDFVVIVGHNGAGKSTLFDMIAGSVAPTHGDLYLDGLPITQLNEYKRADIVTRIFQNIQLNVINTLSVAQNFAFARYHHRSLRLVNGMDCITDKDIEQLSSTLAIPKSLFSQPMQSLSGGQKQLIAFAMATQYIPKILLLDEPTAALDPKSATRLLLHIKHFVHRHQTTTLLITHDPEIALSVGNKIWILENGKITKQFHEQEKKLLKSTDLIGHIDYARLKARV